MTKAPASRVYLVRHGAVSYFDEQGRPCDPRTVELTLEGRAQARATAGLLSAAKPQLVVCSGLVRTRQTAEILTAGRALTIHDAPELREIRAGRLRDIAASDRFRRIAHAYTEAGLLGARFMGGEPWVEFQQRVLAAFEHWTGVAAGQDLLLVVHDAVIRVILAHVCGVGLSGLAAFEQDPAALSILDYQALPDGPAGYFIRAVNMTAYDWLRTEHRSTVMGRVCNSYLSDH